MLELKKIEKINKGIANHNRLKILIVLEHHPGSNLYEIAERLKTDYKNVSQHTRRLEEAGLIVKKYAGQSVNHRLTVRGRAALKFCRMIK